MGLTSLLGHIGVASIIRALKIFPNNDPIVAFLLPSSKNSLLFGMLFAIITVFAFDFFTSGIGEWTYVVAATYILLGTIFGYGLRKISKIKLWHYAGTSIFLILMFDFITGPIMSTVLFGSSFYISFLGQIPFTFMHLISGVTYTIVLVPFLDKSLLETDSIVKYLSNAFSIQRFKSLL